MSEYITKEQASEFSCTGCAFRKIAEKGSHKGSDMCSAPDIEPFRSCMMNKIVFIKKIIFMDKVIEGTKFFNELLVEKGKMTRDDFAVSRRVLRRKYQDEMDKLTTEYAVRNSIYHVGDKVIVCDSCFANVPCTIINIKGIYNVVHEKGVPTIVYDVRMKFDKEIYQVRENDIVGYE